MIVCNTSYLVNLFKMTLRFKKKRDSSDIITLILEHVNVDGDASTDAGERDLLAPGRQRNHTTRKHEPTQGCGCNWELCGSSKNETRTSVDTCCSGVRRQYSGYSLYFSWRGWTMQVAREHPHNEIFCRTSSPFRNPRSYSGGVATRNTSSSWGFRRSACNFTHGVCSRYEACTCTRD